LSANALKGFGGRAILEVIDDFDGDTFRAVYTVRFAGVVYVLHAFQKKSKKGIATPRREIELIKSRLRGGASSRTHRTRKPNVMTKRKIDAHEGSGNIFADLELPDAEGLLLKSGIVIELHRLIKERGLTQVKAAKLLGITQPDLSHLLRGDFEDYSAERLMKMLTVFEQDIEIVMKPHRQSGVRGRITFKPAAA
jgi:predicted XRE-type DNA-binding protein